MYESVIYSAHLRRPGCMYIHMYRSPVTEWQVSWFVLGTITLNDTGTTAKRLDGNVKTFSANAGQLGNICKQRCRCHSKFPKQTSWPATLLLETGTYLVAAFAAAGCGCAHGSRREVTPTRILPGAQYRRAYRVHCLEQCLSGGPPTQGNHREQAVSTDIVEKIHFAKSD